MSKKLIALFALVLLTTVSHAADLKVGIIDSQRLSTETQFIQKIDKKLQDRFKDREQALINGSKEFQAKQQKLKQDEAVLSNSDKTKIQKELLAKQRELQRMQEDLQQDFLVARKQEVEAYSKKMEKVISDYAKSKQLDFVFYKAAAPFSKPGTDITKEIQKRL